MMPLDPNDPKQIKKKRHIGNDDVHIIWNEHCRDYQMNTISGDFGSAKIVVTPLNNGMVLVNVYQHARVCVYQMLVNE
jgi:Rap/ran-GAP